MSQTSNQSDIATDLLTDLERRLQRAEFYVAGAHEPHEVPSELKPSIFTRLHTLEKEIKDLTSSHVAYRGLLELCKFVAVQFPERLSSMIYQTRNTALYSMFGTFCQFALLRMIQLPSH